MSEEPDLFAPPDEGHAPDEIRALVALSLVPGVGPGRIRALLARFGSASKALGASPALLATVPGIGRTTAATIRSFDGGAAVEAQLARAERAGAELVPLWDDRFPALLAQIYDPPAFLWLRGDLRPEDEKAVSIVGTRRASEYGKRAAYAFGRGLAERGWTVVSGLAYGIDAAAHQGALDAGGRTVAVLGSGVDRIYPTRHTKLASRIIESGALLSEYAMGAEPDAPNFPRRNRIVSGLARGTLVAEAFLTGGALITARLALEQDREVFAVPATFDHPADGTNRLIQRSQAKLVLTVDDVLEELGEAPTTAMAAPAPELSGVERQLYEALGTDPVHIDTLCATTGLDVSTALVYLLGLEFRGIVRQLAGKQFLRG